MIALPVLLGCAQTPNEIGEQVRELLLVALGKLMKDRREDGSRLRWVGEMVDAVGSAWLSSLACLRCCTRRARGRIVRTEIEGKGAAGETATPSRSRLVAARGTVCRRPLGSKTITWGVRRLIRTGSCGRV